MSSSNNSFQVQASRTIRVTVYDAAWNERGTGDGDLELALPSGFYRVHFERAGLVSRQLVEHRDGYPTIVADAGPLVHSPVPFGEAASSPLYYITAAQHHSTATAAAGKPQLGDGEPLSRLFLFIRRADCNHGLPCLPSERMTIRDIEGRRLLEISNDNATFDQMHGYVAFACHAAPGTYRLRAERSHRDVAITIPAGRAAHVFIADTGTPDRGLLRLDELRVALVPMSAAFDPASPIWSVMEVIIAALRGPARPVPGSIYDLLRDDSDVVNRDVCFGLAAAHVLLRRREDETEAERDLAMSAFANVMEQLRRLPELYALSDVVILEQLYTCGSVSADIPSTPPLLRDSFLALLRSTEASASIDPLGVLAHAAQTRYRDSIWCTWSARVWDRAPVVPAVKAAQAEDPTSDVPEIAVRLALPIQIVARAMHQLNETSPQAVHAVTGSARLHVPGYDIDEQPLGRGMRSAVYRAARLADHHDVALKVVPVRGGALECRRILDRLDYRRPPAHRRIVSPSRWGALADGIGIWIEMELCKGVVELLAETDTPMPAAQARQLIIDALDGLVHTHELGRGHGAIAPSNLLVRADGTGAIADRRMSTSWLFQMSDGRSDHPRFASPERFRDRAPTVSRSDVLAQRAAYYATGSTSYGLLLAQTSEDLALFPMEMAIADAQHWRITDLWSLTATLYFLLTLEPPRDEYAGQTPFEAGLANTPIRIAERRPDVPIELARCIDRVLSSSTPPTFAVLRDQLASPLTTYAEATELCKTATLLYNFCFEPIKLDVGPLYYEPRWSCACDRCATMWIAWKSGVVTRIVIDSSGAPHQSWFHGDREARTIVHCHDGAALGIGPFLLVGRDNGELDVIPDDHEGWRVPQPSQPYGTFFLDTWWESRTNRPTVDIRGSVQRRPDDTYAKYSWGITAIAVLSRNETTLDILVATRYSTLYVIEATSEITSDGVRRGTLRPYRRLVMPNWIERIITPQEFGPQGDDAPAKRDQQIVCISRFGDLVYLPYNEILNEARPDDYEPESIRLAAHATAAMPFDGNLLLGTTKGVLLINKEHPKGLVVPVARSTVLCMASAKIAIDGDERNYVTMGLADGRLRVVEDHVIRERADGNSRDHRHHSFTMELGGAVLALQILRPSADPSQAYVVAALRDHRIHLFQVTGLKAVQRKAAELWRQHIRHWYGVDSRTSAHQRLVSECAAVRLPPPARDLDAWSYMLTPARGLDAWSYMLIEVVLPRLRDSSPVLSGAQRDEIVELACELAKGATRRVRQRLSAAIGRLAGHRSESEAKLSNPPDQLPSIALVLRLSRAILHDVPKGDDWSEFIESHLSDLNALAAVLRDRDRARLIGWARFVRKYILLGGTFAAKRLRLGELVEQNYQIHKYLDALIYQAQLTRQGYDLRWECDIGEDVFALHVAGRGDGDAGLLVVITANGSVIIVDPATGNRLPIHHDGKRCEALLAFGDSRRVQVLAAAVVGERSAIRVVLSGTSPDVRSMTHWGREQSNGATSETPGLAIIELRFVDDAKQWVVHDLIENLVVMVERADSKVNESARIYALKPVPDHPDLFVVGTEAITQPVGLLRADGANWTLQLANDGSPTEPLEAETTERRALAPGKLPTRALAIAAVDDAATDYLLVAGSDDGFVRTISFACDGPATEWQLSRWDRVTDAITSIALGGREPSLERFARSRLPDDSVLSCYVGTVAGETFALSLLRREASSGTAVLPFDRYVAQPLWRETHDGPVLAMQLWNTPLYETRKVLVTVTEKGRLCIYNHVPREEQVASSAHYYFRGMRFERITLPGRLRALTMIGDSREFMAAGPQGKLFHGELVWLRESIDREIEESCAEERRGDLGEPTGPLPPTMWARLHHLFASSQHHEHAYATKPSVAEAYETKLELCDLVRIDGGALSSYALRQRLLRHAIWSDGEVADLQAKARAYFHRFDPEDLDDAHHIKVVLRSLCRAYLYRHPDDLRREILAPKRPEHEADHDGVRDRRAAIAVVCEEVSDYVRRTLGYASHAAGRLRITAVKELLRVTTLLNMAATNPSGERTLHAVKSAVDSCLRDDNPLVRIETLRALSVLLRDVGVMAEKGDADERTRLIDALFPAGLGSLGWLLTLIVEGLLRFPGFTRRSALVSGAWYLISVLLMIFRIFPERTLTLCDYLVRAGLDIEVLALCFRSLRRPRVAKTRHRIDNLYLLPVVASRNARDEFVRHYDRRQPLHQKLLDDMELVLDERSTLAGKKWYEVDDTAMATRLTQQLHLLARMWDIRVAEQIHRLEPAAPASNPAFDGPLGALERCVAELSSIAAELSSPTANKKDAFERLAILGQPRTAGGATIALTSRLRTVVSGIVTQWSDLFGFQMIEELKELRPGMKFAHHTLLEELHRGADSSVFALDERRVIKVLRTLNDNDAVRRFLQGADLQQLYTSADGDKYIVPILEMHAVRPFLAFVMPRYSGDLGRYLKEGLREEATQIQWADHALDHIGHALKLAHDRGRGFHGDIKPTNILVNAKTDNPVDDHAPEFRLTDFDSIMPTGDTERRVRGFEIVPRSLSRKYVGDNLVERRRWDDVAALSVIVYRILTGEELSRESEDLDGQVERLVELRKRFPDPRTYRVVDTLSLVFASSGPVQIGELLASAESP